jgi:hypothetical protein
MLHEIDAAVDFPLQASHNCHRERGRYTPVCARHGIHSYRMKCESDTILAAMLYNAQMAQHVARGVRMVSYVASGGATKNSN